MIIHYPTPTLYDYNFLIVPFIAMITLSSLYCYYEYLFILLFI